MNNKTLIVVLDEPIEVNYIEWAFTHIGCDAIFKDGSRNLKICIIAYSVCDEGNIELKKLYEKFKSYKYFRGVTKSMIESI